MNKFLLSCIALVLTGGMVQGEDLHNTWEIFDVSSQVQTQVQVPAIEQSDPAMLVPASIVADDDRENITGHASGLEKAVVVLEMDFGGQRALCSGSMVGPSTVLTAAHCLHFQGQYMRGVKVYAVGLPRTTNDGSRSVPGKPGQPGGNDGSSNRPGVSNKPDDMQAIIRRFAPRLGNKKFPLNKRALSMEDKLSKILAQATGPSQTHFNGAPNNLEDILDDLHKGRYPSASARTMWVPSEWIKQAPGEGNVDLERSEICDYGIIVLDNALGTTTGYLGLAVPSNSELYHANILVVGRGGDKPNRSLWRSPGRIGEVFPRYFLHNADQVGGNSGGPILSARNTNTIIGLANFGDMRQHVRGGYPNGGLRITHSIMKAVQRASR